MKNIHPPNGLRLTHPPQISLGRLQILMPENHLGDNLQRDPISTGIRGRISPKVMRG